MKENTYIRMTDEQYEQNIKKLKSLLNGQPLSDVQVSKQCALSQGTINSIKNGFTYGSDKTWERIGKYFGVKFEYEVIKPFNGHIGDPNKPKEKPSMIEKPLIETLKAKGNVFIGRKKVNKFGVSAILDAMKDYGIECTARIPETDGKGIILEICG